MPFAGCVFAVRKLIHFIVAHYKQITYAHMNNKVRTAHLTAVGFSSQSYEPTSKSDRVRMCLTGVLHMHRFDATSRMRNNFAELK